MATELTDAIDVAAFSDDEALTLLCNILETKPQLAPTLAQWMIPELTLAPARAITEQRHNGVIKMFDVNKSFGFIDCPELKELFGADVWLHHAQLGGYGLGDHVEFAALLSKDGKPQAFGLTASKGAGKGDAMQMKGWKGDGWKGKGDGWKGDGWKGDGGAAFFGKGKGAEPAYKAAKLQSGLNASPALHSVQPAVGGVKRPRDSGSDGQRYVGTIKENFSVEKGFGFIECAEVKALYGRDTWLHHAQIADNQPGTVVEFTMTLNKDGNPQAIDLAPTQFGKKAAGKAATGPGLQPWVAKGKGKEAWGGGAWLKGKDAWQGDACKGKGKGGKVGKGAGSELSDAIDSFIRENDPAGADAADKYWLKPAVDGRHVGTVKQFTAEKGFGFIDCLELKEAYGRDTWLHHAQIKEFKVGDAVSFAMTLNKQGNPQAIDLEPA